MSRKKSFTKSGSRSKKAKSAARGKRKPVPKRSVKSPKKKQLGTVATLTKAQLASRDRYIAKFSKRPGPKQLADWITREKQNAIRAKKAKATRARNAAIKARRSAASKRGWEDRKKRGPDVEKFLRERRAVQNAIRQAVLNSTHPEWGRELRMWKENMQLFIVVATMTDEDLHSLLIAMKTAGVGWVRYLFETRVGEYVRGGEKTASGYMSTGNMYLQRSKLTHEMLLNGSFTYGIPSIASMRQRGVKFARFLTTRLDFTDRLPRHIRRAIAEAPLASKNDFLDPVERAFWLRRGRIARAEDSAELEEIRNELEGKYVLEQYEDDHIEEDGEEDET